MTKFIMAKTPNPVKIAWSNIAPKDCMSGQGDCSHAFTVDFSNHDFHAIILCDFLGGKSYQECYAYLMIRFLWKSLLQNL